MTRTAGHAHASPNRGPAFTDFARTPLHPVRRETEDGRRTVQRYPEILSAVPGAPPRLELPGGPGEGTTFGFTLRKPG
ncbi:hypothetical protein [Deinococcus sp. S9]|uniref:hypothetical protein n=1 Tax=Deinococcus sp. S9 TaxID=2545754 RepID=UPI0010DD8D2F|nr:hypothetical protein [Deinococcus sp. S9]TDE85236.1 hypothetical protein E0686_13025 [Deinococcus sp. S9]